MSAINDSEERWMLPLRIHKYIIVQRISAYVIATGDNVGWFYVIATGGNVGWLYVIATGIYLVSVRGCASVIADSCCVRFYALDAAE